MHSELFEFYTPTKDRLSKPMQGLIFHMKRGSGGVEKEKKRKKKKK